MRVLDDLSNGRRENLAHHLDAGPDGVDLGLLRIFWHLGQAAAHPRALDAVDLGELEHQRPEEAHLAAIDLEIATFAFLRERVRAEIAAGHGRVPVVRRAAAAVAEYRGTDVGRRAHQDADNAQRILAEEC